MGEWFTPLKIKKNISVTSTYDALVEMKNFLVNDCGWTLHDDMMTDTVPYFIIKSTGEYDDVYPCYVMFYDRSVNYPTNQYFACQMYTYWDNTTHTGINARYIYSSSQSITEYYYGGIAFDHGGGTNTMHFFGNKDFFSFSNGCVYGTGSYYIDVLRPMYIGECKVSQVAYAGSDVDIYFDLSTPIGNNFFVGGSYMYINEIGQWGRSDITNIDYINNKITVSTLVRDLGVGSFFGSTPHRWYLHYTLRDANSYYFHRSFIVYSFYELFNDNNYTKNNYNYSNYCEKVEVDRLGSHTGATSTISKIDVNRSKYAIYPFFLSETTYPGPIGYSEYLYWYTNSSMSNMDTVGHGRLDSGVTTSATTNTLTVNGKTWTADAFVDKVVVIINGQNAGDVKQIITNNSDTITINQTWLSPLDTTSEYVIYENAFIFGNRSAGYDSGYFMINRIV